jgi:hypothetical protein
LIRTSFMFFIAGVALVLAGCGAEEKAAPKTSPAQPAAIPVPAQTDPIPAPAQPALSAEDAAKVWLADTPKTKEPGTAARRAEQAYSGSPEIEQVVALSPAVPQSTMGGSILGQDFTPKAAGNVVVVRARCSAKALDAENDLVLALFRNGARNAVRASLVPIAVGQTGKAELTYRFQADGVSPQAFDLRVGVGRSGKLLLNPAPKEKSCKLQVEEFLSK